MADHVDVADVIIPPNLSLTHHYDCNETVCRTVTVDTRNGDVHFTTITKGVGVSRIIISVENLLEVNLYLSQVAINEYHKRHGGGTFEEMCEQFINEIVEEEKQKKEAS